MPAPGKGIMEAYYPKKKPKESIPDTKELELDGAIPNSKVGGNVNTKVTPKIKEELKQSFKRKGE